MSLAARSKSAMAAAVCAALILTSPGLEAWAAAGESFSAPEAPEGVSIPALPSIDVPVAASIPGELPSEAPEAAGLPLSAAAASQPPQAAAAAPSPDAQAAQSIPTAAAQARTAAPVSAQPNQPGEAQWTQQARRFDGAGQARSGAAADPAVDGSAGWTTPVPSDLKLKPADAKSVADWMAAFHGKMVDQYPRYEFTVRDYYAWARFVRFYTPSLGIKEAVKRGAAYIYGDRLEDTAESDAFDRALSQESRSLAVSDPNHGKDKALADELLKLAEPAAPAVDHESSPYEVPVSALIPDLKSSDLVMTATTLKRIAAASESFALRDFALLLGPPATEKSAIPKYLAAQHKVPYLAVTMHPGIGVFELVGGYRPRLARPGSLDQAQAKVAARLARDEKTGDYSELLDAAARVYGAKPMGDVLAAIRADLDAAPEEPLAAQERARRLTTLAYALEHGAQSLVWQDGYLTYAIKHDIWITFEELNAAPTETQEFLNEFMRSRRLAVTQKLGETEVVSPRPGGRFMLWATMNPETDSNREVLAQTLKNRWRVKYFGSLPAIETAEIIEKKFGMPTVWALSLVENFHRELDRQARERVIGAAWRDGYTINLRQLLRTARRWRFFVDQEARLSKNGSVSEARQRFLLAREAYSIYGGMMRRPEERAGVFRMLDQALGLGAIGVRSESDLIVKPAAVEDLGGFIRIGDVTLPKGPGGPFVPKPSRDYLVDGVVLARLYEDAKALAMGEPLLLMGDSAAGKTSDLEYLFYKLNRNLRYKNLDSDTAIEEVIGGFAPGDRKGTFTFQEGLVPKAMEEGSGAFLDEFNLNPLVEWLNTVIDDGKLYLPHRIVSGRPMLVAAANPPDPRYPGRILLSAATRSRYTERWVDVDRTPARLSDLMSHWLKGGAGGSFALGRFTPKDGTAWLLLSGAGVIYFFAAAAAHFGNPIGFFAAIIVVWAGIILSDKSKRYNMIFPLDPADAQALAGMIKAKGWQKTQAAKISAENMSDRMAGLRELEKFPGDDDVARMLEAMAKAETTPASLIQAVRALGQSEAREALPALERLRQALPPDYRLHVEGAISRIRARQAAVSQAAVELTELAKGLKTSTRSGAALDRAAALAAALEAKGDLASRLRAQALREKAAELEAASDESGQAIVLRQLEDLLAAPAAGVEGSKAFGRLPVPPPARGLAKLWRRKPGPNLTAAEVASLKAAGAALRESPARFAAGKRQLGAYFDFSGGYSYSSGMSPYDMSEEHVSYNSPGERAARVQEVAKEFPGSDDAALMLERLIEVERTPDVVKTALAAIGAINAPQSPAVLRRLAPKLDAQLQPYVSEALAKTQEGVTVPAPAALPPAAAAGSSSLVDRALSRAAASEDGTLAGRLKAAALREKAQALQTALDSAGFVSRQLEDLLSTSRADAGSTAAGSSWLERLKGAFGSKKKAPEAVAGAAESPKQDDDAPARAPTLEELLRARGVPEKDWPAVRAKVDRVQTIIQMVGGSVGRDTSTRWAPGDLWAFFPDENTVTYPFEDLLTHSEEEIVGLTDHEGGHRDITVLDQRLPLVKKYFQDPLKHFLWNGFEDPRVNNWDIKRMPGAARYLHAAYDRYLPEDLQAHPTKDAPDLSAPQGDGASAFSPEALQYPHVEFIMAGNYYWRYGKRPPKFHNKSAEKAFDAALPEIETIFKDYPERTDADRQERAAYSYDALKRIDEKLLPLYEPLVAESQKKMARQMKGKGKGKGQGQPKDGKGKGGPSAMPPQQQQKPQQGKSGDKKEQEKKDEKAGGNEDKEPKDDEKLDPKLLKEALEELQQHAQQAAEQLGGKIEDQPTNKDVREALKKKGLTPGGDAPKPLTLQDIAQTQREQLVNRQASSFDRAFAPVAHLSGAMVTHLENVFQKNSRPRDEGWYRTGKRPDVKQFMRRQGEGGLRDDYMLRRAQRTKRKYKVTLLVDASGSMAEHAVETSRTAVLLAESLTRLQIDVEIILFSNVARVVKSFEQPMTPQNRDAIAEDFRTLIGSLGNGATHDADALKQALTRLEAQDGDRKFVFVVTDGAGNGPSKLSDALAQANRDGVFVMGVGIGAGMRPYVEANYPRHAVVDHIEALPLKLKDELERYVVEQEMTPRAAPAFVPQSGGSAQGSSAAALGAFARWPNPFTAPAPWRLFYKSWALGSAYLLGVLLILTPLLMLLPHGMAASLGAMPGFLVAIPWIFLKERYGGRYPEVGALGMATMCTGMVAGLVFSFLVPVGYIVVPAVGGLWLAAELGTKLERRFVPLSASAEAALKAALPSSLTSEERAFRRLALGLQDARLKAVALAARAPKRLIPALSVLALRDPSPRVRLAALEALAPAAAFDDGALDALRRAARDGEPSIASRAAAFLKEATTAREAIPQLPKSVDLAGLQPDAAQDPLEAQARTLASAEPAGLAERLRSVALTETLAALDSARAKKDGDAAAVARRRLEDLLRSGAASQGSASAAQPGFAPEALMGYRILMVALPLGYTFGTLALLCLVPWPLGIFVGAPLVAGLLWATRRFSSPVAFEAAYLTAAATILQLLIGHEGPWSGLWAAVIIAPAAFKLFLPRLRAALAPLDPDLSDEVELALPQDQSPDQGSLLGWKRGRLKALRSLEAETPARLSGWIKPVALLAEKDPDPDARKAAVAVLGRAAPTDDKALEALQRLGAGGDFGRRLYADALKARAERDQTGVDLEKLAIPEPAAASADADVARAQAYLAQAGEGLAERLRRAAVTEALRSLEAAKTDGRNDEASLARRRLADLLDAAGAAEGSSALPAPRGGWRLSLEKRFPLSLIAWGKIMGWSLLITSGSLAAARLLPLPHGLAALLFWGGIVGVFMAKGPRGYILARASIVAIVLGMTIGLLASAQPAMVWMGFVCFNLLAAVGTVEKAVPNMVQGWGAPTRGTRAMILRSQPPDATPRQRWWTKALAGTRQARDLAAAEMLAAPQETAAMAPAIGALSLGAPEKMTPELVEILARARTPEADGVLRRLTAVGGPAAPWAREALAKREEADNAPLPALVTPPAPSAEDSILSAAEAELQKPVQTLAERLRAQALREAVDAARRSSGDERRLAVERASALLRAGLGSDQGSAAAAAPARFPRSLSWRARDWLEDSGKAGWLLNAPWMIGVVLGGLLGGASGGLYGFFAGIVLAMAYVPLDVFWLRRHKRLKVPEELEAAAYAAYGALPPSERARIVSDLSYSQNPPLAHPFLKLVDPIAQRRDAAWARAWPALRAEPEVSAPLLGALLSDRRLFSSIKRANEIERLSLLGEPGQRELEGLLAPAADPPLSEHETILAQRALDSARAEKRAGLDLTALRRAPETDQLRDKARSALAAQPQTLAGRLRTQAIQEALSALESSSGDEQRLAVDRLCALLGNDAAPAEGSSAGSQPLSMRGALWSALAASALALGLAFAPVLAALSSVSVLAAAAAGASGAVAVGVSLARPLDFRDPRVSLGPREESPALPEWIPAQRAMSALVARLGLPAAQAPALGLWSDEAGSTRPSANGWSGGLGVNARSVIAVGERWLSAPPAALEGLLAHELGHLSTGEQRWRNVWARLQRLARWSAFGALALSPAVGWLWPVLAGGAWLASSLLGLAWLRRAELRADGFALRLAGRQAADAFLGELAAAQPPAGRLYRLLEKVLSDHPSVERRQAVLRAARD